MPRRVLLATVVLLLGFALAQPAYFVRADMVRGEAGAMGAVCVINAVFCPGEKVVFRTVVVDAATGEELRHEAIAELQGCRPHRGARALRGHGRAGGAASAA